MNMKLLQVVPFFLLSFTITAAIAQIPFDKARFYLSIEGTDTAKINEEIRIVNASSIKEKKAYSGALLMRKAGLVKSPPQKLNLFKSGHKKLEAAIKETDGDAEFYFLRLMIQENAPGILGYKSDTGKDSEIIKKNFKDLEPVVRHAIANYSKKSKILKPEDFNPE